MLKKTKSLEPLKGRGRLSLLNAESIDVKYSITVDREIYVHDSAEGNCETPGNYRFKCKLLIGRSAMRDVLMLYKSDTFTELVLKDGKRASVRIFSPGSLSGKSSQIDVECDVESLEGYT